MSKEYYTVVYRVNGDRATHDEWWESLRPLFLSNEQPVAISAVSKADELTRLDRIREIINSRDIRAADKLNMIDGVLDCLDPREGYAP